MTHTTLDSSTRLAAFRGRILDRALDEELQQLVEKASTLSGFPISLVSLVLRRTQFFRAHVGLPRDLAISQATSRCSSFCQFVVSSGSSLVIEDASQTDSLPQELVNTYGIRSYAGFPIRLHGEVIGSLCVIDQKPRQLAPQIFNVLEEIAAHAGRRLEELAADKGVVERVLGQAVEPAFAEIRNMLASLHSNISFAKLAMADVEGVLRLVQEASRQQLRPAEFWRNTEALQEALLAPQELYETLDDLSATSQRLIRAISALNDALVAPDQSYTSFVSVLETAAQLARHATQHIGGFQFHAFSHDHRIKTSRIVATSLISLALRSLADRIETNLQQGIQGHIAIVNHNIELTLTAPEASPVAFRELDDELTSLVLDEASCTISHRETSITLSWAVIR